jgi:monoamine oxidase
MQRRQSGDLSISEYLERSKLPSDLRKMFINFVEGYHAAHLDQISARSLAAGDEETNGPSRNKQFRILGGYDDVMHWLRAGLDPERVQVRLSTIATKLRWKRGSVVMECKNSAGATLQPLHASAALITIPHAVLKAKVLPIQPELNDRERVTERLEIGQVFKIVLRFRQAFWDDDLVKDRLEKGRSHSGDLNFVHAEDNDVPVWWTALPARVPVITGWAGGPKAELLLNEDEQTRVERSLAALARVLAVPRHIIDELLAGWSMHDWRADPFTRGAYVYVGVGGIAAQKTLAKPVEGTLFFAGEATDPDQTGTVAGAIASGRRAAGELVQALRPPKRS